MAHARVSRFGLADIEPNEWVDAAPVSWGTSLESRAEEVTWGTSCCKITTALLVSTWVVMMV